MENGQLNQTWVDNELNRMQDYYKELGNDLKSANDTCSAGAIIQESWIDVDDSSEINSTN